jgi:hypothetical protein
VIGNVSARTIGRRGLLFPPCRTGRESSLHGRKPHIVAIVRTCGTACVVDDDDFHQMRECGSAVQVLSPIAGDPHKQNVRQEVRAMKNMGLKLTATEESGYASGARFNKLSARFGVPIGNSCQSCGSAKTTATVVAVNQNKSQEATRWKCMRRFCGMLVACDWVDPKLLG